MGVLIKGMEMPKCCADCTLVCNDEYGLEALCVLIDDGIISDDGRRDDCPLVQVKEPHGKLIDVSKLNMYDVSPVNGFCVIGVTEEDIELADAVIEAEGSEE